MLLIRYRMFVSMEVFLPNDSSINAFSPDPSQIFSDVVACPSQVGLIFSFTIHNCLPMFLFFYTGFALIEGRWILLFILFFAHSSKRTMNFCC